MSHPAWLPQVPKWLGQGVLWIALAYTVGSWAGIVQSPLDIINRQQAEVAAMTQRAQTAQDAINMLQWQQQELQLDLAEVKAKLDEMAMVLYSLERRSR